MMDLNTAIKQVNWIGGSPCSGKSSVTELITQRHDLTYYKCDDYLDYYMSVGAERGIPILQKFRNMNADQTWLERSVEEQVEDEIEFCREVFPIVKEELNKKYTNETIVAEGALIMPETIIKEGIDRQKYVCIVPTAEFQLTRYREREWVKYFLAECSNPEKAFENWMARDIRFAEYVKNQAIKNNLFLIIEDGNSCVEERYRQVADYWGFEWKI